MTQEARRSMVWLEWIEIRQFRGVKPGTRLEFNPGFNVLLGRNGTGKTTLLELCAAVLSGDFSKFEDEEFDLSACIASGDERFTLSIRGLGRSYDIRDGVNHGPPPVPGNAQPTSGWSLTGMYSGDASWHVESTPDRVSMRRGDGQDDIQVVSPFRGGMYSSFVWGLARPSLIGGNPGVGEIGLWMLVAGSATRYDEALVLYNKFLGEDGRAPEHRSRILFWEHETHTNRQLKNFPDSYFRRLTPEQLRLEVAKATLTLKGEDWLVTLAQWLGANEAVLRLYRTSASTSAGTAVTIFERPELEVRFSEHLTVTHERLSFGQKRIFAFLFLLALNEKGPLVADELVNGLHYSLIEDCIQYLRGPPQRQAILASQSPLLVDHLEFQSAEQTRSTFILCTAEDDAYQWCQMTASEADEFFGAYEIGIEHVGEILRNRGLW